MRYVEIMNRGKIGSSQTELDLDHVCDQSNINNEAIKELLDEKKKYIPASSWEKDNLRITGYSFMQSIQYLSVLSSSLIGCVFIAVTAFLPLHLLSKLAANEYEYSRRSFMVIDLKSITSAGLQNKDDSKIPNEKMSPPAPPSAPTLNLQ